MRPGFLDALLTISRALPNGAANVTSAASIDMENTARGDVVHDFELLLSAPAMNTTQMPDAKTMIYDLLGSPNADLSAPTVTVKNFLTQTGAGGVGCAAATGRYAPASDSPKYWGVKATGSASGDATGATCTLAVVV